MRNMEERKAEIFRRSDRRIRMRHRMKTVIVSFTIFVGVMAFPAGVYMNRLGQNDNKNAERGWGESINTVETMTVSVEVKSDDAETGFVLEDQTRVLEILNLIHDVTSVSVETAAVGDSNQERSGETSYIQQDSQKVYTIILTRENINTTTYLLYDEKIIDAKDNREYVLSKEQLETLKELLGITKEGPE